MLVWHIYEWQHLSKQKGRVIGMVVNIGVQSFEKIRESGTFYVDKTDFIRQWWEAMDDTTLITRPRRFGKTLNMSMLECFFSDRYENRGDLFEGLSIWKDEKYRKIQGTYPVIFLSFASIKTGDTELIKTAVKQMIANVYDSFENIMDSDVFSDKDRKAFQEINRKMDDITAAMAINTLCIYLEKYYGKKVIILLDEYDTPMQEAWLAGSWNEAVSFFRSFFNATFKTNPHMERSIITGITRISKESIFSDLNHLRVITTTSEAYAECFGFTEKEVFAALDDTGLGSEKSQVKYWYDGFTFGKHADIYNPWSIINFIKLGGNYGTYWADTSGNGLVNSLLQTGSDSVKQTMEILISGESFDVEMDEQIIFNQLDEDENAIWSLLVAAGYLCVRKFEYVGEDKTKIYTLALTNHEVKLMFRKMIRGWFNSTRKVYNEFIKSLMDGNVRKMNTFMNKVALNTFSSFDAGNHPSGYSEPERFYHGFVLGMVVDLADKYQILSNRESGYGRYDVMIEPIDKSGKAFIFEFKVHDADDDEITLEDTASNALAQIEEKRYEATLISDGISRENIKKYGFAFQGKDCLIKEGS